MLDVYLVLTKPRKPTPDERRKKRLCIIVDTSQVHYVE